MAQIFIHILGLLIFLTVGLYFISKRVDEAILKMILSNLLTFFAVLYLIFVIIKVPLPTPH
jgi:hypothetical protein